MSFLRRTVLVAALAVSVVAPGARAETLTDAFITGYRNSHLLEQNRALLRAADEDVADAVSALRPVISYTATAGQSLSQLSSSLSTSITLSASLVIYNFGRRELSIQLAKESVLATRETLVNIEQQVLYSVVSAYMGVISANETVALGQNNVRVITQEYRAAQDRFELGEVTRTDVAQAEAALALARANLASAQGDLDIAREQYKAAVGQYPGNLSRPPSVPRTASSLDAAQAVAVRTHPSILQLQRQVTVSELSIEIAKAAMKPSLSAGVESTVNPNNDFNSSSTLSLRVTGPIYQGGALSASYRQAVANRDAVRAQLLQQIVSVKQAVASAWVQVQVASAQLQASDNQIRAATVAYDGVREEANLGARTTLDVLDAEQNLLDARATRISAYSTYYTATYGVLQAMGLLTVKHLNLGIPTYDPAGYYNAVKDAPVRAVSPQGQKLDRILKQLGKK